MTNIDVGDLLVDELESLGTSFIRRGYASGAEKCLRGLADRLKKCESPEVIDTTNIGDGES